MEIMYKFFALKINIVAPFIKKVTKIYMSLVLQPSIISMSSYLIVSQIIRTQTERVIFIYGVTINSNVV